MKSRSAVQEGRFYPSGAKAINAQIREIEETARYPVSDLTIKRILGGVLPHAGHIYSGHQSIPFFRLLGKMDEAPDTFVILHPNHTGSGLPLSVDDAFFWTNSLGEIPLDRDLADALGFPMDHRAHAMEHSAEVLLPFLQYYLRDQKFSILPVCMLDQSHSSSSAAGKRLAEVLPLLGKKVMVLASCDFSHFLTPEEGYRRDQYVLDEILQRNIPGVELAVDRRRASICGYGPIMALMEYAAGIDPDYKIKVLARGHSGEVYAATEVVNYISMLFYS